MEQHFLFTHFINTEKYLKLTFHFHRRIILAHVTIKRETRLHQCPLACLMVTVIRKPIKP